MQHGLPVWPGKDKYKNGAVTQLPSGKTPKEGISLQWLEGLDSLAQDREQVCGQRERSLLSRGCWCMGMCRLHGRHGRHVQAWDRYI